MAGAWRSLLDGPGLPMVWELLGARDVLRWSRAHPALWAEALELLRERLPERTLFALLAAHERGAAPPWGARRGGRLRGFPKAFELHRGFGGSLQACTPPTADNVLFSVIP